jgi:hypothetical protein
MTTTILSVDLGEFNSVPNDVFPGEPGAPATERRSPGEPGA